MEANRQRRTVIVAILIGAVIGLGTGLIHGWPLLWRLELMSYDWRLSGGEPTGSIVIVAIDDESMNSLQNWPWPRSFHARVIRTIAEAGAKTIGVDVIFSDLSNTAGMEMNLEDPDAWLQEPEPSEEDRRLQQAIKDAGNVILAAEITEQERGDEDIQAQMTTGNFPHWRFEESAAGIGLVNFPRDVDGVVRRMHISRDFLGQTYSSFAVALAQNAAEVSVPEPPSHTYLPNDTVPIAYRGPPGTYRRIPYYQVLNGTVDPEVFRDRIVLIGATAPVLQDIHLSPMEGTKGKGMPGVEIQANSVATVLSGPWIRPIPVPALWVICVVVGIASTLLTARWRPLKSFPAVVVPGIVLVAGATTWALGAANLWIPLIAPVAAIVLSYVGVTVYMYVVEEAERRRIRSAWQKRVSEEVLEVILDSGGESFVRGRNTEATVLFSDIRGFTSMCDALPPEEVVAVLNEYFECMTQVIISHHGTIHKFIGDGIMAVFGDPVADEHHADQAVRAAIDMHKALGELRSRSGRAQIQSMQMGVGIHSGELVAGDIGSEDFMEYTTIGRTVSIAARLEGENKEFGTGIIISEDTRDRLEGRYDLIELGSQQIRGVTDPIPLYAVSLDGEASDTHSLRGE